MLSEPLFVEHEIWVSPRIVVANVLNCEIEVSEFEPQSRYFIHVLTNTLEKNMNSPAIIEQLLFFNKDDFGI